MIGERDMNASVCADIDMTSQYASFLNIETPTIGCGLGKTCDNFAETPVKHSFNNYFFVHW
jgi:hypothetical protein